MFSQLDELAGYSYYFEFTLTGFGKDIERNVPHKKTDMIPIFQELSRKIGKEKVIWRYDPILFTDRYTPEYHLKAFEQIARELRGYTLKCVLSFVDTYAKNQRSMKALNAYSLPEKELYAFCSAIARIANNNGMRAAT